MEMIHEFNESNYRRHKKMNEQDNSKSAFIKSMKQTDYFTEWVKTAALVAGDYESDHLHDEMIEKCNQNAEKIVFQSGSYVKMSNKTIYVFTIWVDTIRDELETNYTNEIQRLLASLNQHEESLDSIAVKMIDETGIDNVYYWRLVFNE